MTRYWKQSLIVLLALAIFVPIASASPRIFFSGGFYGPAYYGPTYYGPAYYGPGWVRPYAVVPGPASGKIKIETKFKDANVYVDGGFAGTVGQLKTFPLHVGSHDIELRDRDGRSFYQERVEVVGGKTTKLVP